jgi:hypothetical protein
MATMVSGLVSDLGCDRHARHVGACPACQRVQLARWRSQLIEAEAARGGTSVTARAQITAAGRLAEAA